MPRVLITGGEGDLAKTMKHAFLQAGYEVLSPGRKDLDVCDLASISAFFEAQSTPFDLVVSNAGITQDQLILKLSPEAFDEVMLTNFRGAQRVVTRAVERMIEAKMLGHVIFISSISSVTGPVGQVAYASSKAALHGLAQSLALEWGRMGIRVNVIWPGFLETKMTQELSVERVEAIQQAHALGRFNQAQQVADFIIFMDQKLRHTSGQIFNLDSRIHPWN